MIVGYKPGTDGLFGWVCGRWQLQKLITLNVMVFGTMWFVMGNATLCRWTVNPYSAWRKASNRPGESKMWFSIPTNRHVVNAFMDWIWPWFTLSRRNRLALGRSRYCWTVMAASKFSSSIRELVKLRIRPLAVSHVSPKRSPGQSQILRTGDLQSRNWRPQPTVNTGNSGGYEFSPC